MQNLDSWVGYPPRLLHRSVHIRNIHSFLVHFCRLFLAFCHVVCEFTIYRTAQGLLQGRDCVIHLALRAGQWQTYKE